MTGSGSEGIAVSFATALYADIILQSPSPSQDSKVESTVDRCLVEIFHNDAITHCMVEWSVDGKLERQLSRRPLPKRDLPGVA